MQQQNEQLEDATDVEEVQQYEEILTEIPQSHSEILVDDQPDEQEDEIILNQE